MNFANEQSQLSTNVLGRIVGRRVRKTVELLGEVEQHDELGCRAGSDAEESLQLSLRASPQSFGDVGGDGDRRAPQLVGEPEAFIGRQMTCEVVHHARKTFGVAQHSAVLEITHPR